jgi:hypothetical protein
MNQPAPTGPDLFAFAEISYDKARAAGGDEENDLYGSPEEIYHFRAARHHATQAQTAAVVMLAEVIATASGVDHDDLDAWREKIGVTWLKECRSKEARRPACAARHTEDCAYADPVPEPKHVLLPVGTRVLVSPRATKYEDGRVVYDKQPKVAKIVGYDLGRSKYQLNDEKPGGGYYDFVTWAFADNRVQPHPEQDGAVAEPTGPRVYVQRFTGTQGHIIELAASDTSPGKMNAHVHWYTTDGDTSWIALDNVKIIPADEVDRCPFGQTFDECGEGENQCEQCLAAEDAEADMIEESMGLR